MIGRLYPDRHPCDVYQCNCMCTPHEHWLSCDTIILAMETPLKLNKAELRTVWIVHDAQPGVLPLRPWLDEAIFLQIQTSNPCMGVYLILKVGHSRVL